MKSLRRSMLMLALLAMLVPAALAAPAGGTKADAKSEPVTFDTKLLKGLEFRSIGPANMGGRISDFAVNQANPAEYYVATATGGVFKTTNQGTTWKPVFDDQPVASTGAIALCQARPTRVWVGTGESNNRNSSGWGRGLYLSDDGGATWTARGLEHTASIARVVCDPTDSNTVWVAAMGRLWGANPERGVYRTTDAGRTWQQVLKVDDVTGAIDLTLDPRHPQQAVAALYARKRTPWSYSGVSTTGGILRTVDGGKTWTKAVGLPARTGRIGLSRYAKNPDVLFAVVESDEGGQQIGRAHV